MLQAEKPIELPVVASVSEKFVSPASFLKQFSSHFQVKRSKNDRTSDSYVICAVTCSQPALPIVSGEYFSKH